MRSLSNFAIFLLCLAILIIDILTFYWLLSITQLISWSNLSLVIHIIFWLFTIGLLSAIALLKYRLDKIHPQRKHLLITSLYGLTISSFIPKIIFYNYHFISLFYQSNVFRERIAYSNSDYRIIRRIVTFFCYHLCDFQSFVQI